MENLSEEIVRITDDLWWHTNNMAEYDYQLKVNTNFMSKILPHLKNNNVVIQAGGSCGWLVKQMYPHFKHIYTFEPNNLSFLCLCLNLPQSNVYKFNSCVGNERKLISMSNHYSNLSSSGYITGNGKIPTLLIDDLNVSECDFIQLDLEGFEYFGLLGAKNTIEKFKPVLCIECCWHDRYGISKDNINNLIINKWGYKLVETLNDDCIYKHDN
jgi:FkbM family methyltransferase